HTADNTMVWVPEHKILVGGCAVKDLDTNGLGYTGDADVEAWPRAIDRAQEAYPEARTVVPGHGPVGDTALLRHTHALLTE
ncbi:MAG: subclass B1 metallo-beta-lactamase, partial [Bacteroidota bacterium]